MDGFKTVEGWKSRVEVVVLKVMSPSHFFIREAPCPDMSPCAREFIKLEAEIRNNMKKWDVSPLNPLLPEVGAVILVRKAKTMEWYRGRVVKFLETTEGYKVDLMRPFVLTILRGHESVLAWLLPSMLDDLLRALALADDIQCLPLWTREVTRIFLVDYGETFLVDRKQLRKLFHERLLEVPFQCVTFSLPELQPLRWTLDRTFMGTKYVASDCWDRAALEYVKAAVTNADTVKVQVLGETSSGGLTGRLFVDCNKTTICLNEELIKLKFAVPRVGENSEEMVLRDEKTEMTLGTGTRQQPLVKETQIDSSRRLYMEIQRNVATAALKDVYDDIMGMASKEVGFPLEVSRPESQEVSPPPSVSDNCSSPTQWSSSSSTISMESSSTDSDTSPTLPGLGRGLALYLQLDELRSPGLLQKPDVVSSTNDLAEESKSPVLGLSPDVVHCTPTPVGFLSENAGTTDGTASVASTSVPPPPPLVGSPELTSVSDITSKPFVTSASSSGPPKARGRARFNQSYLVMKAQYDPSIKVRPPRASSFRFSQEMQEAGATTEEDGVSAQAKTSDFCGMGNPGNTDSPFYHPAGRGLALGHLKARSDRTFPLPFGNEPLKLHKSAESDHKPAPVCMDVCSSSSGTVSKAQRLKDLLQRQSRPLNRATLGGLPSLTSQAGEEDGNLVQKEKWHSQFISHQAPMNVNQGLEDLQFHDFQSSSEFQSNLDPSELFSGPVDFVTNYDAYKLMDSSYCQGHLLCHGVKVPIPQEHLDKTIISKHLKANLRSRRFRAPTPIQSVVWPAVESGRNVIAVGPPHSGKTHAYLIPLVSRILTETDYKLLPKGVGPLMLILASTWRGVHRIYEQTKLLTEKILRPRCSMLYGGGSENGKEIEIVNGCDILVATPNSFLRYLENYKRLIVNLNRCCHLVLDDGERLLDKYAPEIAKVLTEFWRSQDYRNSDIRFEQLIVCSTTWTKGLDLFLYKILADRTPLVFFSSFFEAAVYAQVQTITHFAEPHRHNDVLLDILQGSQCQKVVICTSKKETAIDVNRFLSSASIHSLLIHDELPMAKVSEVSRDWMSDYARNQGLILVVQDNVLFLTRIRDATVLVHYDIPSNSKSSFGFRYSCLAGYMKSFRAMDNTSLPSKGPVAHLILTSNDKRPSVQLVEFLTRCGSSVPDELRLLAAQKQSETSTNAKVALCTNLKSFGHCESLASENKCPYRHQILPAVDHSSVWSGLPSEGEVLIVVTRVMSASHFYAWILQHWDTPYGSTAGTKAEAKEHVELQKTMLSLNEYFSQPKNCARLEEKVVPTIGQVYALEVSINLFHRVLVTSLAPKRLGLVYVTVDHIDYGDQSTVAATRLMQLPSWLSEVRPFAVEVYCCRIQPQDYDVSWTCQANLLTCNRFSRKELFGKVVMRLGNTLWLDPLVMREKLAFIGAEVTSASVRSTLMVGGFACPNKDHLKILHKMATDAGLPLPPLPEGKKERDDIDNSDTTVSRLWSAHLETKDFNHVYLWKVLSPSRFYVQTLKFNSCLDKLEDDIQKAVERHQVSKLGAVRIGACCLAQYNDDRWYRGEVLKSHEKGVDIFFPDYGDTETCKRDELLEPASWMMLLPYQGISCSLAGISPQAGEWSPAAHSLLEDFGYDDSNINRLLCLGVARKMAGSRPGDNHYEVFLFDGCHSGRTSIGDLLVEKGLAVRTPLPEMEFNIALPHEPSFQQNVAEPSNDSDDDDSSSSSDDDDDDPIIAECRKKMEDHVFSMYCNMLNQILAPGAAALSTNLQAQGVDELSAQNHQITKKPAPERSSIKKKPQDRSLRDIPTLESIFKVPSSHQAPLSWWQDDRFVYVNILVENAKGTDSKVTKKSLFCRVHTADREYLVHESLFAAVLPKKAQIVKNAKYFKVTLEKAQFKLYWDFLTGHHRKSPHIRYDLDKAVISEYDEDDILSFCAAYKDPAFTGYERPGKILPYDPVAHAERLMEIEPAEDEHSDSSDDMFVSSDPNNIFEAGEME